MTKLGTLVVLFFLICPSIAVAWFQPRYVEVWESPLLRGDDNYQALRLKADALGIKLEKWNLENSEYPAIGVVPIPGFGWDRNEVIEKKAHLMEYAIDLSTLETILTVLAENKIHLRLVVPSSFDYSLRFNLKKGTIEGRLTDFVNQWKMHGEEKLREFCRINDFSNVVFFSAPSQYLMPINGKYVDADFVNFPNYINTYGYNMASNNVLFDVVSAPINDQEFLNDLPGMRKNLKETLSKFISPFKRWVN